MSELTKEHFNEHLKDLATKKDLAGLATKQDINNLATRQDVKDAVEDLARIVNTGFEEQQKYLEEKLDVRERVSSLEKDMGHIKGALHIK